MSALDSLSQPMREAFAIWQALRKLGFSANDIFMGLVNVPGPGSIAPMKVHVRVELHRGPLKARFVSVEWPYEPESFTVQYTLASTQAVPRATLPELQANWENSIAFQQKVALITTIIDAGITIPTPGGFN